MHLGDLVELLLGVLLHEKYGCFCASMRFECIRMQSYDGQQPGFFKNPLPNESQ